MTQWRQTFKMEGHNDREECMNNDSQCSLLSLWVSPQVDLAGLVGPDGGRDSASGLARDAGH